jgi:P27 family predicted phage terminase small subunit
MQPDDPAVTAPKHLTAQTRAWFLQVVSEWRLDTHHVKLLQLAAESWDRGQQARRQIAREGITVRTRDGGRKRHPAVAIEEQCRIAFTRLTRELDLDLDGPKEASRPPMLRSVRPSGAA